MKSKRFEVLAARPVNQDGYVQEWPEVGLIAMNSPFDPKPSIKIENGVITEMDGKCRLHRRPRHPPGQRGEGHGHGFPGDRPQDRGHQRLP